MSCQAQRGRRTKRAVCRRLTIALSYRKEKSVSSKSVARVVARAMNSNAFVSEKEDGNSERDSSDGDKAERDENSRCKRRRAVHHSEQMRGEIDRCSAVFKHSGEAQRALEKKKLAVEKRKLDVAEQMRAADRQKRSMERKADCKERAEQQESRERLKMERFRMLMEMMMTYKK